MRIPSSEAEVKSTDASIVVVDNNDFLVVRPELDVIYRARSELSYTACGKQMNIPLEPI